MESGPAAWQTDKINAKVNKDIAVTEKEPEIFLSFTLLAGRYLSVSLCLVSEGESERARSGIRAKKGPIVVSYMGRYN